MNTQLELLVNSIGWLSVVFTLAFLLILAPTEGSNPAGRCNHLPLSILT